jgi:hypothetical protein
MEFVRLTCEQDLEGIVAKLKHGRYGEGWLKIRNPKYSQRTDCPQRSIVKTIVKHSGYGANECRSEVIPS